MISPQYVASCSGGKDSVATLILAAEHGEPIVEAIFCEVMFDPHTSGEVPEHRDFIYDVLKPFCEKEIGIKFTILRAGKTYEDVFHHIIVRGPHKGMKRGFVWPGMCVVNRDCKIPPIDQYKKSLSPNTVTYVGIAADEPARLSRLDGTKKVSLLSKYGLSEKDAMALCAEYGLLSPIYNHTRRNGCWFCPNAGDSELTHMLIHHPDLFERLLEWEREDNVFHHRLTRTETPFEIKKRLLAADQADIYFRERKNVPCNSEKMQNSIASKR